MQVLLCDTIKSKTTKHECTDSLVSNKNFKLNTLKFINKLFGFYFVKTFLIFIQPFQEVLTAINKKF